MTGTFYYQSPFTLESGHTLKGYHLAYSTYGEIDLIQSNVVWVFHALTANSDPAEWWPGLVGEGKLFDPAIHFIVCVNMPGSCYGSIGPLDSTGKGGRWYHDFPMFTTRDMINAYKPLREYLGIKSIMAGIGGSMGGQQLLEWAVDEPGLFENIFPIACNARHSAWGIAFNTSQRQCIETDDSWLQRDAAAGMSGMKAARSVALLSYRNYDTYKLFQTDNAEDLTHGFKSDSYQRYQGEKLAARFNAFSYYFLSQSMDAHNLGRERGGAEQALKKITARALVIGIKSDILFPLTEQQFLAAHIKGASFHIIHSKYGHDGFLLEYDQISELIHSFLKNNKLHAQEAGK